MEELKNLFDSLEEREKAFGMGKLVMEFGDDDCQMVIDTVQDLFRVVNILEMSATRDEYLIVGKAAIEKMFHTTPLDEMPLYINDPKVSKIAAWRLRIAK
jgi:hypothetical protein